MNAAAYDPWEHAARLPGLRVVTGRPIVGGESVWGLTDFARRTVTLHRDLDEVEARTTLAHELVHLERGPVPPAETAIEEALVDILVAARLIPVASLPSLAALVSRSDAVTVGRSIGVDEFVLEAGVNLAAAIKAAS